MSEKGWSMYLLECRGRKIYTGISNDVEARIKAHHAGLGAKFTRAHPPVRLLVTQSFPDKSSAACAEWAMKQKTSEQKWAWVLAQQSKLDGEV